MAGTFAQPSAAACGASQDVYDASVISSASTLQSSIFSADDVSEQSSVASSTSDDFRTAQDDGRDRFCASAMEAISVIDHQPQQSQNIEFAQKAYETYASITSVPPEQRQHPRRSSLARNQKPPPLVRQAERKLNFVDNLVDSATQMVEVIWPLSMINCRIESAGGRGVLPLRTYIEETLRRSRTSYSTLQVALYYLVLIKTHVPGRDSTTDSADHQANRVLVCGRRMFLAALILASKYLQDRNYSAKAWSKMSGLRVTEINANERIFLEKINWRLHVAKPIFDRWTEIVLKYTPSSQPPSPPPEGVMADVTWKAIIPILTPELDGIPLPVQALRELQKPATMLSPSTPTPVHHYGQMNIDTMSQETTPTPATITLPPFRESRSDLLPPTPGLVRMGPLPTPQMTPSTVAASTPAASVCSSRRPSICSAMSMVQRGGMTRINDEFPFPNMDKLRMRTRRPSIISMSSARSSPESMITDMSRSSRASSISSVTTMSTTSAGVAPRRSNLCRLATTRNVKLPLSVHEDGKDMDGTASRPITITEEDDEAELSPPDFAVNERKLHAPHRHSKHAPHVPHTTNHGHGGEKSRKRHRHSRGGRRSDLYDEVRYQLEDEQDDKMVIDLLDSDEDMTSPSPAADQASSFLRRGDNITPLPLQAKAFQPPAALSRSTSGRIPLSRHDGSKRTCYSADENMNTNNAPSNNGAALYMEIA